MQLKLILMLIENDFQCVNPCLVTFEFCPVVFPFLYSNVSDKTGFDCRSASLRDYRNNTALRYFRN